jgi:hypothetical protein
MIAILYPLKMDKNLSEAYSSIYESSASDGSSDGNYHDVGGGDFRSKDQIVRMNNDPKGTKKYGRRMMKGVGNVITDLKIPTVKKQDESLEPEMDVVEGQKYGIYKGSGKASGVMKDYLDKKAKKLEADQKKQKKEYRNNPAFGDPSHHSNKKMQYNSRYRKEWEEIKLMEMNEYRDSFEEWLNGLVEEGYDIERWDDADLIETFINESDLWDSKDAVIQAITESDKKGKGSGTKDACYHKVKSRYSVWPSAYASGALVKCRKKGAKNWGNSSKKEGFSDWRSDIQLNEILEKGTKGKVEFHSGRSAKENRQVMKTKRKTVNNPKGRKIHQSPMGKTLGKLSQVKSKQWKAEDKGDTKTAQKMYDRRKKLSGVLFDKTGNFHDRADND